MSWHNRSEAYLDSFIDEWLSTLDAFEKDLLTGPASLTGYRPIPPNAPITRLPNDVGYGEISSDKPARQREALANLNQDMIYARRRLDEQGQPVSGRPMLVSYDALGNVYARVLSPDQQQIDWQGRIGTISPHGRRSARTRGRDAQAEIATLLQGLGHSFRTGDPSHHGADLVRTGGGRQLSLPFPPSATGRRRTTVMRGTARRRAGTRNFDAFDPV